LRERGGAFCEFYADSLPRDRLRRIFTTGSVRAPFSRFAQSGVTMNHFLIAWLPSLVGTLLAWSIGWRQGKQAALAAAHQALVLENLLLRAADAGLVELDVDGEGRILGGAIRRIDAPPSAIKTSPGNVTVFQGPGRTH
jgi:hypothetical protein